MKICFISKYPPIEGGEAAKAYWLIRNLGKRGHKVYVATNAFEVEDKYRETLTGTDLKFYQPQNVSVFNINPFINPHFIPFYPAYCEKLTSLAMDIVEKYKVDLIDSWYLIPYGIAGAMVKNFTQKPLVIRHAGSDITRLYSSAYLNTIIKAVLKRGDKIITYPLREKMFLDLGINEKNLFFNTSTSVDIDFFHPSVRPTSLSKYAPRETLGGKPIITYIGKIGETKGIFELIKALARIKKDFLLWVVGGENQKKEIWKHLQRYELCGKAILSPFVPPWRIPGIIRASTCVVCPEHNFPVRSHSPILPREVMATGKCLILSEELFKKRKSKLIKNGLNVLVINPDNIEQFSKLLERVMVDKKYVEQIGREARIVAEKTENFSRYVSEIEKLYRSLLDDGTKR